MTVCVAAVCANSPTQCLTLLPPSRATKGSGLSAERLAGAE
jgi:hypothetical protein